MTRSWRSEWRVATSSAMIFGTVSASDRTAPVHGEQPSERMRHFTSAGRSPGTGAVRSDADTVPKIIEELVATRHSERQLRVIDHDQDGSMELKKREGYF